MECKKLSIYNISQMEILYKSNDVWYVASCVSYFYVI